MAIKVNKLWSNKIFSSLSVESKLFYIYLATHPSISTIGVVCPNLDITSIELSLDLEIIRACTRELIDKNYIHVGKYNENLYFLVIAHYSTLPKSEITVRKINNELNTLPEAFVKKLRSFGITSLGKTITFKKPTVDDVINYCLSQGYLVNAQDFIDFYETSSAKHGNSKLWFDSRGKPVRDWQAKLRKVWFKEDRKLKSCPDAPKGFEYFHIIDNGEPKFPDGWKNGKPYSKDFVLTKTLQKEYEKRT